MDTRIHLKPHPETQRGKDREPILYLILATGRGERLKPLTDFYPSPLVPFGSMGTLIDFTMYNCLASEQGDVIVLADYLSEMIQKYLETYWLPAFSSQGRTVKTFKAQSAVSGRYPGSAEALFQIVSMMDTNLPELIVVLDSAQIYRMNYRDLIKFHLLSGKSVTLSTARSGGDDFPRAEITTIDHAQRLIRFRMKPASETAFCGEDKSSQSIGIYVFSTKELRKYIKPCQEQGIYDLASDLIPRISAEGTVGMFHFTDADGSPKYWRKVFGLGDYWMAQIDLLDESRCAQLFKPFSRINWMPFQMNEVVAKQENNEKRICQSLVSVNARIGKAWVEKSVVSPGAVIEDGAIVKYSVLMENSVVRKNVELTGSILGPFGELERKRFNLGSKMRPSSVERSRIYANFSG